MRQNHELPNPPTSQNNAKSPSGNKKTAVGFCQEAVLKQNSGHSDSDNRHKKTAVGFADGGFL
jgi:hypothetical protein